MVTVVQPNKWTVGAPIYQNLAVDNTTFGALNAGAGYAYDPNNTWALTSPRANTLRFEVRAGDHMRWGPDLGSNKERSEIASNETIASGEDLHVSYQFNLEPGAVNTAKWLAVGQLIQMPLHGEATLGPPVSIQMVGEKMAVWVRYEEATGSIVQKQIYIDSNSITRGQDYDIHIYANIVDNATGRLMVVRDGHVIADYSGPLGYMAGEDVQWKEGVYRDGAKETVAADYSNLQISSGDTVQIPAAGTKTLTQATAPDLALTSSAKASDGGVVTLAGHATSGTTVRLFDGSTLVGNVVAAANGSYSATLMVGTGSHILTAATVNASGALSQLSNGVSVQVGAAADILNRMPYIDAMSGLSTIILTDTNVLKMTTGTQMSDLLRSDKSTLDMIVGGYSFVQFSGMADYRRASYYDQGGNPTYAVTDLLTKGTLTRETKEYYNVAAGGVVKEVLAYNITGQSYTSQQQAFDASGRMIEVVRYNADGSHAYRAVTPATGDQLLETYNAAGVLQNYTITHPAGSATASEGYSFNVSGQAWTSAYAARDANGKQLTATHSFADGSLQYDYLRNADGTTIEHSYAPGGALTSVTITAPNGRTTTQSYASGALTRSATTYADGSSETDNWSNGFVNSSTMTHVTGAVTKEVYSYGITGKTYAWTYVAYGGSKAVSTERYHADGTLDSASYTLANGSTEVKKYSIAGVIASDTITATTGATETRTYANGALTRVTIANTAADGAGVMKFVYDLGITGQTSSVRLSTYDASNKLIAQTNPATVTDAAFALSALQATVDGHPNAPLVPLDPAVNKPLFLALSDPSARLAIIDATEDRDMTATPVAGLESATSKPVSAMATTLLPSETSIAIPHEMSPVMPTPTLTITNSTAASDHSSMLAISGKGQAGATVTCYDGANAIATGTVDGSGTYAMALMVAEGVHSLTVHITNDTAHSSSTPVSVAVLDAAHFVDQAASLTAQSSLSGILLTGSNTIAVPAGMNVATVLAADSTLVAKIVGGYTFTQTIQSGGTTVTTDYDATGHATMIDTDVQSGGVLAQHIHQDLTAATGTMAKEVVSYSLTSAYPKTDQAFDASGKMLWEKDSTASGALIHDWTLTANDGQVEHLYAADGSVTQTSETNAAGQLTMTGSTADNAYTVTSLSDRVIEGAAGGTDIVSTPLLNYTLAPNVERLTFIGHGDAALFGNSLDNTITGGAGNDTLIGGTGADIMIGGQGDDSYRVDNVGDGIVENVSGGIDTVTSSVSYALPDNVEHLRLVPGAGALNGTGNVLDNSMEGNEANNVLNGGNGNDIIKGNGGNDTLIGGSGNDTLLGGDGKDILIGGTGVDKMYGRAGADRFVFGIGDTGTGKAMDWITDFSHADGDKIDLSGIDANTRVAGLQGFTFYDKQPTTPTAGALWLTHVDTFWQVHADTNGDGFSDFEIRVDTPVTNLLGVSDFILHG